MSISLETWKFRASKLAVRWFNLKKALLPYFKPLDPKINPHSEDTYGVRMSNSKVNCYGASKACSNQHNGLLHIRFPKLQRKKLVVQIYAEDRNRSNPKLSILKIISDHHIPFHQKLPTKKILSKRNHSVKLLFQGLLLCSYHHTEQQETCLIEMLSFGNHSKRRNSFCTSIPTA